MCLEFGGGVQARYIHLRIIISVEMVFKPGIEEIPKWRVGIDNREKDSKD